MVIFAVTCFAWLILLLHCYILIDTLAGLFRMRHLSAVEPNLGEKPPKVSIIVPACNEAGTIGPALQTLLDQDYPNLEIIVIDDRSKDDTGRVVTEHSADASHDLHLIRIDELPSGWIGKPHALQTGAKRASGDILLFTDADIRMEASAVSRAVSLVCKEHIDHLCVIFQPLGGNWLLNALILDAASGLLAMFKPWQAGNPKSRCFMGVGAFNMVRRNCYNAVGGHREIAMHPIDDLMLGKLIKENGFSQKCLLGRGVITVYWYESVSDMVSGLMKNTFSVFHYRLWMAVAAILFIICAALVPVVGMCVPLGGASYLFAATVAIRCAGFALGAALSSMHPTVIGGAVLAPLITIFVIVGAALKTTREQGITWRGSFYSLERLRSSRPLLF